MACAAATPWRALACLAQRGVVGLVRVRPRPALRDPQPALSHVMRRGERQRLLLQPLRRRALRVPPQRAARGVQRGEVVRELHQHLVLPRHLHQPRVRVLPQLG